MKFLRVSRQKSRRFFPCGAFLSRVVGALLTKCPNFEKTPLPSKIPGYAPDHTNCSLYYAPHFITSKLIAKPALS